jgi:hypothetical protein
VLVNYKDVQIHANVLGHEKSKKQNVRSGQRLHRRRNFALTNQFVEYCTRFRVARRRWIHTKLIIDADVALKITTWYVAMAVIAIYATGSCVYDV